MENINNVSKNSASQTIPESMASRNNSFVDIHRIWGSEAWENADMSMPVAVGEDASGDPVILDLACTHNILIAGNDKAEVREGINSVIASLLLKLSPDRLKLIMASSDVAAFEDYKTLPHLLTPVISDTSKVITVLDWVENEMERRYRQLAIAGVKNIAEYNSRKIAGQKNCGFCGAPIPDSLPYLVVIIDELADVMMTGDAKEIENFIVRIGHKGRTAGIQLIVSTRVTSPDVITGVIQAQFTSFFCFRVNSVLDSRAVLGTGGAEKLAGIGDMLLMWPYHGNIENVHSAFVHKDIKQMVKSLSNRTSQYCDDILTCLINKNHFQR